MSSCVDLSRKDGRELPCLGVGLHQKTTSIVKTDGISLQDSPPARCHTSRADCQPRHAKRQPCQQLLSVKTQHSTELLPSEALETRAPLVLFVDHHNSRAEPGLPEEAEVARETCTCDIGCRSYGTGWTRCGSRRRDCRPRVRAPLESCCGDNRDMPLRELVSIQVASQS